MLGIHIMYVTVTAVFDLPCEFKSRFTMHPNPDSLIEYRVRLLPSMPADDHLILTNSSRSTPHSHTHTHTHTESHLS